MMPEVKAGNTEKLYSTLFTMSSLFILHAIFSVYKNRQNTIIKTTPPLYTHLKYVYSLRTF